jgi:hypothetical protein
MITQIRKLLIQVKSIQKNAKGRSFVGRYRNFHLSLFHHHAYGWSEFEDVDRPTWLNERFKAVIKYPIASHSMQR